MNSCAGLRRTAIVALALLAVLVSAMGGSVPRVRGDASAADAVTAFYMALAAQQDAAAYALLSPAFQAQQPYPTWVAGYATMVTVQADVTQLAAPNRVAVYLTTLDQNRDFQDVVSRYRGAWTLVPDGAGGWLLDNATIQAAAEPAAYATTASDFTAFAGLWHHHDFAMTIDAAGDAQERAFAGATPDGQAEVAFSATFGSSAVGTVVSSSGPTTLAPGAPVSLTLLPFDMAVLVQQSAGMGLVLCGSQPPAGAPLTVFQGCGA